MARTLVAAATDERAWGRPWHVPTAPALSVRELANRAAEIAGTRAPKLSRMPAPVLWVGGLFDPMVREMREVTYQFDRPFLLDSTQAETTFGIAPTSVHEALRETLESLRAAA